jgi:hypothetical protein
LFRFLGAGVPKILGSSRGVFNDACVAPAKIGIAERNCQGATVLCEDVREALVEEFLVRMSGNPL